MVRAAIAQHRLRVVPVSEQLQWQPMHVLQPLNHPLNVSRPVLGPAASGAG
jgi:hypothetical protein